MASIENLEIVVNADIGSAVTALNELKDELDDIADAIRRVDRRGTEGIDIKTNVEGIEDELAMMTAQMAAFQAAAGIDIGADGGGGGGTDRRGGIIGAVMQGGLRDSLQRAVGGIGQFNLRMESMHNAMAQLVPMLFVFLGALPAAITALYTLATAAYAAIAALYAFAGLGALALGMRDGRFSGARLERVLQDIQDSFIDAFQPLLRRIEPLVMDAIGWLEEFFGVLAGQGDELLALADDFADFGDFLMAITPRIAAAMSALVEAMAPVFGRIGRFFRDNFGEIVRGMVEITYEMIPALAEIAGMIVRLMPTLVRLSMGFMDVAQSILFVVTMFSRLFGWLPVTTRMFGALIAITLSLVTVFALLNSQLLALALRTFVRLGVAITGAIAQLTGYSFAALMAGRATRSLQVAVWGLIGAMATLAAVMVLPAILGGIASAFGIVGSEAKRATDAIKEFDEVSSNVSGMDGAATPYREAIATALTRGGTTATSTHVEMNMETTGNPDQDDSNAKAQRWRMGRTTGGEP